MGYFRKFMLIYICDGFHNLHTLRYQKSFGVNFSFKVQGHFKVISRSKVNFLRKKTFRGVTLRIFGIEI